MNEKMERIENFPARIRFFAGTKLDSEVNQKYSTRIDKLLRLENRSRF